MEIKNLVTKITSLDSTPLNKWEWFKLKVTEKAIAIGKLSVQQKRAQQNEIVTTINNLCSKVALSNKERVQLDALKSQLDSLFKEKAWGAFVHSRARWIEEGEKNSSYF
ncbi:hypothetical protein NQD34_013644 [Periophthalmus magnuspinnatus]|nr:hypothetical protein NQD34_013644 [Periophthalmus magnuspinnatus]